MTSGYDFSTIYGMADHSGGLIDGGTYAAVIESSEYGRTKDGTKGQWTVKTRITDPASPYLGRQLTGNITVSPESPTATGIMFRHLGALGVPVPDPKNPAMIMNGQVPFWINPQTGQPFPNDGTPERMAAQMMQGKPVLIRVIVNDWEGGTNNKIKDWTANPGGPVTWPQTQGSQAGFQTQPFGQPGYGQPAYPPQPGYPPQGYPPQPGYTSPGPQQPAAVAPGPWQNVSGQMAQQAPQPPAPPAQAPPPWAAQPQQPPAIQEAMQQPPYGSWGNAQQAPQGQPPVPGAPAWAQPPVPGQGGGAEFTTQGMSQQPGITPPQPPAAPQPPWAGQAPQGYPQQPAGPPQQPFAQPQPNGYPQQPQQGQPQQPQQPGEAPPVPPWAQ